METGTQSISLTPPGESYASDAVTRRMPKLAPMANVLIVDPDEVVSTRLAGQLETRGFHVVTAVNGVEALERMTGRYFPVVITRARMPQLDGFGFAEALRARGNHETCLLMLSTSNGDFDYDGAMQAGVDDYLSASLAEPELYARINAAVNTATLRRALDEASAALAAATRPPPPVADWAATTQIAMPAVSQMPKVLVVGNDERVAGRLKAAMAAEGFDVVGAPDGAAALTELQGNFRSIVVVDRTLTDMDGAALCRAVRQRSWNGYVYLVLLTDPQDSPRSHLESDAGADDYVSRQDLDAQVIDRINTGTRDLPLERARANAMEERQRMTLTDPLTGAHNRRYFMRYLGTELKRARRFAAELSLLSLEIDHFRQINENYGHPTGDAALQGLADTLQKCLPREYDWFARLGGDGFAVVLPQTDFIGAAVVAEKLRKAIVELPRLVAAELPPLTVSIGVSGLQAMADRDFTSAEKLLEHATESLARSKAGGGNCVSFPE